MLGKLGKSWENSIWENFIWENWEYIIWEKFVAHIRFGRWLNFIKGFVRINCVEEYIWKSYCLWHHFVSLWLEVILWKYYEGFPYCLMVADIACTCLIGFVWIIELYVAFTGGTECRRHSCFRGESSFSMSVSHTVHWTNVSVSLLVLNQVSSWLC